jgi:hypothetical protein
MSDSPTVDARREQRAGLPLLLRAFFLVAIAFTAIGVLETGFIAFDLWTGGSLSAQRAPDLSFGIRSWKVHHELRPGFNNPAVRTNSFGLRSPEVAVPKPAGTFRILLLGDSFTFGLRAADDQVFARRLEQQLREHYHRDSIEVVNAGVLSYCPLLEYLQYRHYLHGLEPDVVILNFDMSDVQDQLAYSRELVRDENGVPLFVTEPSLGGNTASPIPRLLLFEWLGRRVRGARGRIQSTLEGVGFVRDQDRYLWALDDGPPMDREAAEAMAPIVDLQTLLAHNHIPLVLATYPQPWQVSADATPLPPVRDQYGIGHNKVHLNDRPFKKLAAFAMAHDIPFVNATEAFRSDASPAGLFLSNDFHFSPHGHDRYASVLADFIVGRSLVRGNN